MFLINALEAPLLISYELMEYDLEASGFSIKLLLLKSYNSITIKGSTNVIIKACQRYHIYRNTSKTNLVLINLKRHCFLFVLVSLLVLLDKSHCWLILNWWSHSSQDFSLAVTFIFSFKFTNLNSCLIRNVWKSSKYKKSWFTIFSCQFITLASHFKEEIWIKKSKIISCLIKSLKIAIYSLFIHHFEHLGWDVLRIQRRRHSAPWFHGA